MKVDYFKNEKIYKFAVVCVIALFSFKGQASDCGFSGLTENERTQIEEGKQVLRTDFSKGIQEFSIQQIALLPVSSLFVATSNFWNILEFGGVGLVEQLKMHDGSTMSDNPYYIDGTPLEGNPFGNLYQPFTYEVKIHRDGDSYQAQIHYLTSPNLVLGLTTNVCLSKVGDKVIFNYDSHFQGNPKIGFDTPGFGLKERVGLWMKVFNDDIKRIISPKNDENISSLKEALLGNTEE